MGNLTIAVIGSLGYAGNLGKKGTTSDITFYNLKRGDHTVTFVEPTRYPERISSLFYSVSMATKALVVVDEISSTFGECVIMLHAAGIREGYLITRNYISYEQVRTLVKGTVVECYLPVEDNPIAIRERLLQDAESISYIPPATGESRIPCSIPIDHFFPVKGIGVVVLGCIASGLLLTHDTLQVLPQGSSAVVRSIQKHDDDVAWAGKGDRVGLALKNIELEDLERGDILTNDTSISVISSCDASATLSPYWQSPFRPGMVVHIGHWMQFIPARILDVDKYRDSQSPVLTLAFEKPLVFPPAATAVLCHLEGNKLRVAGTITLPRYRTT